MAKDQEMFYQELLKPISRKEPAGKNLRFQPVYDEIQKARQADDDTLPYGVWQRDLKKADWDQVIFLCQESLIYQTKDYQIAAWLLEAWVVKYGLQGLNQGLQLLQGLCEKYWDNSYPRIEKEDFEDSPRSAIFDWINQKITERILSVKLTYPKKSQLASYAFEDWIKNKGVQKSPVYKKNPQKVLQQLKMSGEVTPQDFKESTEKTDNSFYKDLLSQIDECLPNIKAFETIVLKQTQTHQLFLYNLRNHITEMQIFATHILKERNVSDTQSSPKASHSPSPSPLKKDVKTSAPLDEFAFHITSRQTAYKCLKLIANYLEHQEPHSPTPYLIRKAALWGQMSLAGLIEELAKNQISLTQLQKWLDIEPTNPKNSDTPET